MRSNVLGLDVGSERVGVALVRGDVRIPVVLTTLQRKSDDFWDQLRELIKEHDVTTCVLGLPRGLDGQETQQTASARAFGSELAKSFSGTINWQDEALTSVKAKEYLNLQGKPYQKADVDGVAATIILSDYINDNEVNHSE
ncbi:MAG: Holliday junction resolvase RuvX [Candidatus Saccharimonadales bacterium]